MNSTIAVLGGTGFIGSALTRALVAAGFKVRVLARTSPSASLASIRDRFEFVKVDASSGENVLDCINDCSIIFDLANSTYPSSSMSSPIDDIRNNLLPRIYWLSRIHKTSVKRIVYLSSGGTVYGEPNYLPIDEMHPTQPIVAYGATKLAIENYIQILCGEQRVQSTILRPSNVYGEGQQTERQQGIVGIFIDRAKRSIPISVFGSGQNIRDYIHLDDVVSACIQILKYKGKEVIFNVGTGVGHSILDLIEMVQHELEQEILVLHELERNFDVSENILDSSLLTNATGWKPLVQLSDGVKRCIIQQAENISSS
jgi:UDP-glucose 4-epimerase